MSVRASRRDPAMPSRCRRVYDKSLADRRGDPGATLSRPLGARSPVLIDPNAVRCANTGEGAPCGVR